MLGASYSRSIVTLAKRVKEETGGEVKIVTIERRPVPHGLGAIRYNQIRNSINRYLKNGDAFTEGRLVFSEARVGDSQDGVHLRLGALLELSGKIERITELFAANNW